MRNNISKMDYTVVKNKYVIWDFFVTIKKCPHVHIVYSCFSQMIPLSLHEKQCRILSIPKLGHVQLSMDRKQAMTALLLSLKHRYWLSMGIVCKSGFYLWGITSSLSVKPDTFESWARLIPAGSPNIVSPTPVPLVALHH